MAENEVERKGRERERKREGEKNKKQRSSQWIDTINLDVLDLRGYFDGKTVTSKC